MRSPAALRCRMISTDFLSCSLLIANDTRLISAKKLFNELVNERFVFIRKAPVVPENAPFCVSEVCGVDGNLRQGEKIVYGDAKRLGKVNQRLPLRWQDAPLPTAEGALRDTGNLRHLLLADAVLCANVAEAFCNLFGIHVVIVAEKL